MSRLRWLGFVLAAGIVVGALALQPLAVLTVVTLFVDNSDPAARPMAEGLPTPAGLQWSRRTLDAVLRVGRMPQAGVLGFEIGLFLALAYLLLRALNPTFRLTTGVDWNARILTKTYMHTAPLIKAFLIAITAFLPLVGLWWLIALAIRHPGAAYVTQAVVTGVIVWLLFSREGVAGDYDSGNYLWPSDRRTVASLAGRGAAAGLVAGLTARLAPFHPPDELFATHALFGGIGEAEWWRIAGQAVGLTTALGMGAAGACLALALPGWSARRRVWGTCLCAGVCAVVLWYGRVAVPAAMRNRFDLDPGVPPNAALARRVGAVLAPSGSDTVLLLGYGRADTLQVDRQSATELDLSPDTRARIEDFLRRRNYRTTLAGPAFGTLFDGAALDWNDAELLRLAALRLDRCPDLPTVRLFVGKLETCAATPVARRYAALLADPRRFRYGDNDARLLSADLFARLGMRELAERWYRLSGIAETRIADRYAARSAFGDGVVTGRLLLDGKPATGARVGLVSEEAASNPGEMFWSSGRLRPGWMAAVSPATATDRAGRFRLERIVAGAYRIIVRLPGPVVRGVRLMPGGSGAEAGLAVVGPTSGPVDVGTLDLRTGR